MIISAKNDHASQFKSDVTISSQPPTATGSMVYGFRESLENQISMISRKVIESSPIFYSLLISSIVCDNQNLIFGKDLTDPFAL
jgi:hypothetical protein